MSQNSIWERYLYLHLVAKLAEPLELQKEIELLAEKINTTKSTSQAIAMKKAFKDTFGISYDDLGKKTQYAGVTQSLSANNAVNSIFDAADSGHITKRLDTLRAAGEKGEAYLRIDRAQFYTERDISQITSLMQLGKNFDGKPLSQKDKQSMQNLLNNLVETTDAKGNTAYIHQELMTGLDANNKANINTTLYAKNKLYGYSEATSIVASDPNAVLVRTDMIQAREEYLFEQIELEKTRKAKITEVIEEIRKSNKNEAQNMVSRLRELGMRVDSAGLPDLSKPTVTVEYYAKALGFMRDHKTENAAAKLHQKQQSIIREIKDETNAAVRQIAEEMNVPYEARTIKDLADYAYNNPKLGGGKEYDNEFGTRKQEIERQEKQNTTTQDIKRTASGKDLIDDVNRKAALNEAKAVATRETPIKIGDVYSVEGDAVNVKVTQLLKDDNVMISPQTITPTIENPVHLTVSHREGKNVLLEILNNAEKTLDKQEDVKLSHGTVKAWLNDRQTIVSIHKKIGSITQAQYGKKVKLYPQKDELIKEMDLSIRSNYKHGRLIPSFGLFEKKIINQMPWILNHYEPDEIPSMIYLALSDAMESLGSIEVDESALAAMTPQEFMEKTLLKPAIDNMYEQMRGRPVDSARDSIIRTMAAQIKDITGEDATPYDVFQYVENAKQVIDNLDGYRPIQNITLNQIAEILQSQPQEQREASLNAKVTSFKNNQETTTTYSELTKNISQEHASEIVETAKDRARQDKYTAIMEEASDKAAYKLGKQGADIHYRDYGFKDLNEYTEHAIEAGKTKKEHAMATINEYLSISAGLPQSETFSELAEMVRNNMQIGGRETAGLKDALIAGANEQELTLIATSTESLGWMKKLVNTLNLSHQAKVAVDGTVSTFKFYGTIDPDETALKSQDDGSVYLAKDRAIEYKVPQESLPEDRLTRRRRIEEKIIPQRDKIIKTFPYSTGDLGNMYRTRIGANPVDSVVGMQEYSKGGKSLAIFDYETTTLLDSNIARKNPKLLQPLEAATVISRYDAATGQQVVDAQETLFFTPRQEVIDESERIISQLDHKTLDIASEESWFLRNIAKYSPEAKYDYADRELKITDKNRQKFIDSIRSDVAQGRKFLVDHTSGTFADNMKRIDDTMASADMYGGVNAADFDVVFHERMMIQAKLDISQKNKFIEMIHVSRALDEDASSHSLAAQVKANLAAEEIASHDKGAHRAIDDAVATSQVAGKFATRMKEVQIDTTPLAAGDMISKITDDAQTPKGVYRVEEITTGAQSANRIVLQNVFDSSDKQHIHGRNFTELEDTYLKGWETVNTLEQAKQIHDDLIFDDRRRAYLKNDYDTLASMERRALQVHGANPIYGNPILEADKAMRDKYDEAQRKIATLAARIDTGGKGGDVAREEATRILFGQWALGEARQVASEYKLTPTEKAIFGLGVTDELRRTTAAIRRGDIGIDLMHGAESVEKSQRLKNFAKQIGVDPNNDAQIEALMLRMVEAQNATAKAKGFASHAAASIDVFETMDSPEIMTHAESAMQKAQSFSQRFGISEEKGISILSRGFIGEEFDAQDIVDPTLMLDDTEKTLLRNARLFSDPPEKMSSRQHAAAAGRAGGIIDLPDFQARKQLLEEIEDMKAVQAIDEPKAGAMIKEFNERIKTLGAKPKRRLDKVIGAGTYASKYGKLNTKSIQGKPLTFLGSSRQAAQFSLWGAIGEITNTLKTNHPELGAENKIRSAAINEVLIPHLEKEGLIPAGMANKRGSLSRISRILADKGATSHIEVDDITAPIVPASRISQEQLKSQINELHQSIVKPVLGDMDTPTTNRYLATKEMRKKLGYKPNFNYTQPLITSPTSVSFSAPDMAIGTMTPDVLLAKARDTIPELMYIFDQEKLVNRTKKAKLDHEKIKTMNDRRDALLETRKKYLDELKKQAEPKGPTRSSAAKAIEVLGWDGKDPARAVLTAGKYAGLSVGEIANITDQHKKTGLEYLAYIQRQQKMHGTHGAPVMEAIGKVMKLPRKDGAATSHNILKQTTSHIDGNMPDGSAPLAGFISTGTTQLPGAPASSAILPPAAEALSAVNEAQAAPARQAINTLTQTPIRTSKIDLNSSTAKQFLDTGFGKAAAIGGALVAAAYLIGQFTNQGPLMTEQRPRRPDQIPGTDGNYVDQLPEIQQSPKQIRLESNETGLNGARFRVSAKNNNRLSTNDASDLVSRAVGQRTNININRNDNVAELSNGWLQEQFSNLINRGYVH